MTSSLKCSSETRGNCTKLLFLFCASGEGCDACCITCVNSRFNLFLLVFLFLFLFIAISQSFLSTLDYTTRKEVKEEGRKEGKGKEGTREQNGRVHNSLEAPKNEVGRRHL